MLLPLWVTRRVLAHWMSLVTYGDSLRCSRGLSRLRRLGQTATMCLVALDEFLHVLSPTKGGCISHAFLMAFIVRRVNLALGRLVR